MSQKQQHQQQQRRLLEESRICSLCGKDQSKDQYSKNQWKKGETISKCITCIIVAVNNKNNNNSTSSETNVVPYGNGDSGQEYHTTTVNNRSNTKKLTLPSCNESFHNNNNNKNINVQQQQQQQQKKQPTRPTQISLSPRPQMNVPGFEEIGLTVCKDWPQTKNGQPPNAQSAIFMPLLACVVGQQQHLEGYYTEEQLHIAQQWWTQALPSWPRWISALRKVGVHKRARDELLQLVASSEESISNNNNNNNNTKKRKSKSNPNPLIFKSKGRGLVPHLKGKNQIDLIEMDSMVAIELYACIACMYNSQQQQQK